MNHFIVFFLGLLLLTSAFAEDDIYKVGQDKTFTASCVDADTRYSPDPSIVIPLDPTEISHVTYYIDDQPGNLADPLFYHDMQGGCAGNSFDVDLTQFPAGITLYKYATTTDTSVPPQTSVPSDPRSFRRQKANPNAPGQIR